MRLKDRVALVTGAAGGLGSAIAARFAQEGALLALADIGSCEPLRKKLAADGARALACSSVDVTSRCGVQGMVDRTVEEFGRIDILVNVAGIVSFGAGATLDPGEWDRVIAHNLTSVFHCIQAVIPVMRQNGYGRIISMGSILGKNGGNPRPWLDPSEQKAAGNVAYGVAKAGINAMTFYFAKELAADGVTVNVVAPGPIATGMTKGFPETLRSLIPVGRMGHPEEVADSVAFLAGEQAGFITGEILDVNGGAWMD